MKLIPFLIVFLVAPLLISNSEKHDYYVSVTKIEYSNDQQTLQIINQIFINDFEKLLRQRYDENITLNTDQESQMVETYMQRYISDKLNVKVNGEAVNFKFIGKEYQEDIVYSYLEIENVLELKSIEVTNRILFDILPEQQNILRLKIKNKNKSFLLVPSNATCMLNFD